MGSIVSTLAFPAPPAEYSKDVLLSRIHELKYLTTKNGLKIPALHIRKAGARFTILYSHGNAEDVGICAMYLDRLAETCHANVLAYEYPGYSISEGIASEPNCYEAIDAAYKYLTTEQPYQNVDPSKIVVFGRSLGTGPSVDLCSRTKEVGGCVLQSPLESGIRCVMGDTASFTLYPLDIFRSYQKVDKIECPVFIMHGERDRVVPCSNGRALYKTLCRRKCHVDYNPLWIESAGHNDIPEPLVMNSVNKFLLFLQSQPRPLLIAQESIEENNETERGVFSRLGDCCAPHGFKE